MAVNNSSLLASDSQIIFVNDIGRNASDNLEFLEFLTKSRSTRECEAKKNSWELYCHIYHVRLANRRKETAPLNVVLNESQSLTDTSNESVKKVQELLYNTPVDIDGITRIVFAHSHGAKVLFKALDDFKLFLRNVKNINSADIDQKIQSIRDHLAIFTLGAMQDIPKYHAKICFNLYLPTDKKLEIQSGNDANVWIAHDDGSVEKHGPNKMIESCIKASGIGLGLVAENKNDLKSSPYATALVISSSAVKKGYDVYMEQSEKEMRCMHKYLDNSALMNKILHALEISED